MTEINLKSSLKLYFDTLASYGRTVSKDINPAEKLFEAESKFLPYLDDEDLVCWFCYKPMVIIQIDYRTQRPVWGCLKDKATMGLQKIKWLGHCSDCGKKLEFNEESLAYQKKYLDNGSVKTCCEKCIGNGNILTEDDMPRVHKKVLAN